MPIHQVYLYPVRYLEKREIRLQFEFTGKMFFFKYVKRENYVRLRHLVLRQPKDLLDTE